MHHVNNVSAGCCSPEDGDGWMESKNKLPPDPKMREESGAHVPRGGGCPMPMSLLNCTGRAGDKKFPLFIRHTIEVPVHLIEIIFLRKFKILKQ